MKNLRITLTLAGVLLGTIHSSSATASDCFSQYQWHAQKYWDKAKRVAGMLYLSYVLVGSENDTMKDFPELHSVSSEEYLHRIDEKIRYVNSFAHPRSPRSWIKRHFLELAKEIPDLTFPEYIQAVYDGAIEGVFCAGNTHPFMAAHYYSANNWMRPKWDIELVGNYIRLRVPASRKMKEMMKRKETLRENP